MDIKTLTPIIAAVIIAVGMVMAFSDDGGSVGVPGVNLYPTSEITRAITPTADITLTANESGAIYMIATGTTATLPAAREGLGYRFMVSGAFTDTNFVIDSAEGDNIEGSLIVAGAVVDCAAEDQINVVVDGENLGDFVELYSDGTSWLIGASGALTSAKMTCTDPS